MIVVDASALVAIGRREPDWIEFLQILEVTDRAVLSAINYVEAGIVLTQRGDSFTPVNFNALLSDLRIEVREDVGLADVALAAYLRFGKGFHPARLNLGDCFAYALAKQLDVPLLYRGDDFAMTDIRSALQPT